MDLKKRLISAFVMIVIVVTAVLCGAITFLIAASIVALLMMVDVTGALKSGGYDVNRYVLIITAALLMPAIYFFGTEGLLLLSGISFSVMAVFVILSKEPDFKKIFGAFFALVYPLIPAALLVCLAVYDVKSGTRTGCELIIYTVICACLSDIFAYFGGRLFGKKKLCPAISPKKTVAGSIASFLGGAVGGAVVSVWCVESDLTVIPLWIAAGFLCGGFSQIGDLLASMLKRFCGVKDYGKYIPGHGGIMDRMDSISVCLIVITAFAQLILKMEIL